MSPKKPDESDLRGPLRGAVFRDLRKKLRPQAGKTWLAAKNHRARLPLSRTPRCEGD